MRLLVFFAVLGLGAGLKPAQAAPPTVRIVSDAAQQTTTVVLQANNGTILWADIAKGIAQAKGLNASALDGVLPPGGLNLRSWTTGVALVALNTALSPLVDFELSEQQTTLVLRITLNRKALLATARRLKAKLRSALMRRLNGDSTQFGLKLDSGWQTRRRRLVVFVHGFHSSPETSTFKKLRGELRAKGHGTGVFRYPNDQPISPSAKLLSDELKKVGVHHPDKAITLIAKSMGGLVVRTVVETNELDPLNVDQVILVATPNQGSLLAHFGFALELWEHVVETDTRPMQAFYASLEDGLGEAADDLTPGSPFLTKLNSSARNSNVKYSVLLGDRGYLTKLQLRLVRDTLRTQAANNRFVRLLGPQIDEYLVDLHEVVTGLGDGAVAIKRGKLKGVADTEVLPFDHVGASDASPALRAAIKKRVKR